MNKYSHTSGGYSNRRTGASAWQLTAVILMLAVTFGSLYYMRELTELQLPARLIIGLLASLSLICIFWMVDGWAKDTHKQ